MKGFTFIELMVAMTVFLLLFGTISKYNDFHNKIQLTTAIDAVIINVRLAQTLSIQGKKPVGGCTSYVGYRVVFDSSTTYYIEAACTELNVSRNTYQLPSSIQFQTPVPEPVVFKALSGTVDTNMIITLTRNGSTKNISIQTSGLVEGE